jgi:hypothetical protein
MLGHPFYQGHIATFEVTWEQQVTDDQNAAIGNMPKVPGYGFNVAWNSCDLGSTMVIAKLEIGYVVLDNPFEQIQRLRSGVEVRLPHNIR